MDATPSFSGDVRTWFFLVLGLLISGAAYILKSDRDRMDKHDARLNNHSQRLKALDGETEND